MMKYTIISLFLLFVAETTQVNAQKSPLYLLPDFVQGTVLMKNGARTTAMLNYDVTNRRMMFRQGHELLILTNVESVDTIISTNVNSSR